MLQIPVAKRILPYYQMIYCDILIILSPNTVLDPAMFQMRTHKILDVGQEQCLVTYRATCVQYPAHSSAAVAVTEAVDPGPKLHNAPGLALGVEVDPVKECRGYGLNLR